jgi:hypothetical protein
MKARKVKGLDPEGDLRANAGRIISLRADELCSFSPAVLDPTDVDALHDMRIAAKRLRYVLELHTPVLGDQAARAAKRAKKLQDLLGEIHDCDVMVPRVERHIQRLRLEDAAALREAAGPQAEDLDPKGARDAPNRLLYRGLESLIVYLRARRDVLYTEFVRTWEPEDFAVTLGGEEEDPLG